ncbi:ABC transporter ATP-binding protein [Babesia caballi]|uniref:ABC transporter ATP-binding protein n=1 Tax=Babesia caballi TaxID=5871 RepID=A0AAV4LZ65_BABCB|nr:ABC transporter ATP-binding protein [Babesia caballi]
MFARGCQLACEPRTLLPRGHLGVALERAHNGRPQRLELLLHLLGVLEGHRVGLVDRLGVLENQSHVGLELHGHGVLPGQRLLLDLGEPHGVAHQRPVPDEGALGIVDEPPGLRQLLQRVHGLHGDLDPGGAAVARALTVHALEGRDPRHAQTSGQQVDALGNQRRLGRRVALPGEPVTEQQRDGGPDPDVHLNVEIVARLQRERALQVEEQHRVRLRELLDQTTKGLPGVQHQRSLRDELAETHAAPGRLVYAREAPYALDLRAVVDLHHSHALSPPLALHGLLILDHEGTHHNDPHQRLHGCRVHMLRVIGLPQLEGRLVDVQHVLPQGDEVQKVELEPQILLVEELGGAQLQQQRLPAQAPEERRGQHPVAAAAPRDAVEPEEVPQQQPERRDLQAGRRVLFGVPERAGRDGEVGAALHNVGGVHQVVDTVHSLQHPRQRVHRHLRRRAEAVAQQRDGPEKVEHEARLAGVPVVGPGVVE